MHSNCKLQLRAYCHNQSIINLLKTRKCTTVSCSFVEVKYQSMAASTSELIQLMTLLASLGVFHDSTMHRSSDNHVMLHILRIWYLMSAQNILNQIVISCRRSQMLVILLSYTSHQTQQSIDIFTKALRKKQFMFLQSKLSMIDHHALP